MNSRKERKEVEIKCVVWEKDSHGLFDYESKSVTCEKHRIDNSCQIISSGDKEIKIIGPNDKIEEENTKILANVSQKDNKTNSFFINPVQSSIQDANTSEGSGADGSNKNKYDPSPQDAYLIVRTLKGNQEQQKGYPMQVGDMIKLGRLEYCVIEKNTEETGLETTNDIFCDSEQYNFTIDYSKTETKTCRICLCEEEQCSENPLLNPCNCKGSCEYMHFECLKHWVESKVHKKQTPLISSFKWKNLECEVCKQPLPKVVNINNKKMSLIEVPKPEGNYIILEGISREKKVSKGLYIIHNLFTDEDSAKLGRGHQCDVRVQDISVSRCHSYIKFLNNQFLLFDNNSKFGTLVRLDKDYPILSEKVGIQVGRTVITFVLKSPISPNLASNIQGNNTINNNMMTSPQLQIQPNPQSEVIYGQDKIPSGTIIPTNNQRQSKLLSDQQNNPLQQQQSFSIPQQFKTTQNMTMSNFYSQNPNVRIATSSNLPQQPLSSSMNQSQKNTRNQGVSYQQTSSQPERSRQKTNNPLNKAQKPNTFISNAANNIIGTNQPVSNSSAINFNATTHAFSDLAGSGLFNSSNNSQPHRNLLAYEHSNSSNLSSQGQGFQMGQSHTSFPLLYSNFLQPSGGLSGQGSNNNNTNNNNNNANPGSYSGLQNAMFSHQSNSNVQPSSLLPRNQRNLL